MTDYYYYLDGVFYDRMSNEPEEVATKVGAKVVSVERPAFRREPIEVHLESYGPHHSNWYVGELLFEKVKDGGKLKLISWDAKLMVEAWVKEQFGTYGLALRKSGTKRWGKCYERDKVEIIRYLAQFREINK